ncbi:Glucosaminyl phosphatidylinositol (GlcN-PI) nositol acylation protein [Knufia peltigerae]|uniref:GPI-anchored wall transfer protein n=1 Tax=Knufia peltigerae TaxID=1002370 RepID=A0AA39D2M5_9EURO|nr:Glucosaminyl phosphatidylinositol (GlcN-PI) nositol acylation protein [Knufia peltigerae]
MLVVTCLSILAVDFPIFPRRFAKVETWGTSLMDLGVGLFVFSAGVVSARSVVKRKSGTLTTTSSSFTSRFLVSLRHAFPLFVLGVVRLLSVKNLDYAEHVTEYGVHWNFFFTLCLLPPFVEISDTLFMGRHHAVVVPLYGYDVLAVAISFTYEIILNSHPTLLRYILISERGPSWLSKNREGVFSFVGYLAIFLAGRGTGGQVVTFNLPSSSSSSSSSTASTKTKSRPIPPPIETRRERLLLLRTLFIRTMIYSSLFIFTTDHHWYGGNLTVSRRLANLPYVLWVAAFNNAQLFLFGVVEHLGPDFSYSTNVDTNTTNNNDNNNSDGDSKQKVITTTGSTSRILGAFNNNGLAIFLIANLLTGLVNLTLNTLDMAPLSAMAILVSYAAVVTAVALGLDRSGIKIKL